MVAYISKDSYFSDSLVCVYEKAQKKTLRKIKTAKKNLMHTWCIDDNFGKLIPDIIQILLCRNVPNVMLQLKKMEGVITWYAKTKTARRISAGCVLAHGNPMDPHGMDYLVMNSINREGLLWNKFLY